MNRPPTVAIAAALLASACGGPQADAGYGGEPLASFSGTVDGVPLGTTIDVVLAWQLGAPPSMDDLVSGSFEGWPSRIAYGLPVEFDLGIHYPPAEHLSQLQIGEVPYARANAVAVPPLTTRDNLPSLPRSGNPLYGADVGHWVIYLPQDVPAGSLTAWWLGGALTKGYHFVAVSAQPCLTGGALDACVADLRGRGVPDDPTATAYCNAGYELTPALWLEGSQITVGVEGLTLPTCP